jgi:tagatose-1,6-bisphosphate aldolase
MKSGLYKVEAIDKRTALLTSVDEQGEQFTFPVTDFTHDVSVGDVVEIWREGLKWKTKYREEKTESISSHAKDFMKRMLEKE